MAYYSIIIIILGGSLSYGVVIGGHRGAFRKRHYTHGNPLIGEPVGMGHWEADGMLDYLALICLLALCVGHYYLIRGCMGIQTEAGSLHALMEGKLAETNNLLNEVAEILEEGIGGQPSQSPVTQTGHPLMALLSTFLTKERPMPVDYGTQETERSVHEIDETQTLETENQPN